MPHLVTFDEARRRVTVSVTPPVELRDAFPRFREIRTHPLFEGDYTILVDILAVERSPSALEAMEVANVLAAFFPGQRVAFVRRVPAEPFPTELLSGLANLSLSFRYFTDLAAADAWLES